MTRDNYIYRTSAESNSPDQRLFLDFAEGRGVDEEVIKDYAKKIAEQYQKISASHGAGLLLVVDQLSDDMLINYLHSHYGIESVKPDKNYAITVSRIRSQLLFELSNYLDPDEFIILKRAIHGKYERNFRTGRAGKANQKEVVYKELTINRYLSAEEMAIRNEAFQRFQRLPSHLNIFKNKEIAIADDSQSEPTASVAEKICLQELTFYFKNNPKKDFSSALLIFLDNLQGAKYLSDNGLVLFDICLLNLGHNTETDRGVLFDFDWLYIKGATVHNVPAHNNYGIPEQMLNFTSRATEANMVYQFGVALGGLISAARRSNVNVDVYDRAINNLGNRMVASNDPATRPTLAECITGIENIIRLNNHETK